MENKKISLIIAFYNKIELLRFIFVALERQTFRDFEVIIADDGSRPDVVSQLNELIASASFPVKHVWHEDNGWQKNIILNSAVRVATSPLLVFIDGDCLPNKYFLEDHYSRAPKESASHACFPSFSRRIPRPSPIFRTACRAGFLRPEVSTPSQSRRFSRGQKRRFPQAPIR